MNNKNLIYITKILTILVCSFVSTFYFYDNLNIILTIPILIFCFFVGIDYFITSIIGIVIGNIINYHSYTFYIAVSLCLFFVIFLTLRLFKIKTLLVYFFCSAFSITLTYIIKYFILQSFNIHLSIVLFLSSLISLLFAFIIHTFPIKSMFFIDENSYIISIVLLCIYLCLIKQLTVVSCIMRVLLAISAIKNKIKPTLCIIGGLFICTNIFNLSIFNILVIISVPTIIISFFKEKNKYSTIFLYLISSVIISLLINYKDFKYDLFETLISSLIMLLLPKTALNPINKPNEFFKMYLYYKNDLYNKLDEFSNMFKTLSDQFIKSKHNRVLQLANIEVFDKLCFNCFKNQHCHQNGNHLLMNYLKDGILNNLNDNKIDYIKNNCLKADAYLKLVDKFMNTYLLKKYQNDELCSLKDIVSSQFLGFSKIMDNYKNDLINDKLILASSFYQSIKVALEEKNYDIIFVNNYSTSDCFQFDIAISTVDIKIIKQEIIPIINKILQCNVEVIDIFYNNLLSNYIIISIRETKISQISYFYKQNGKDLYCGDSVNHLDMLNKFYFVISDGMGNGIEAKEESNFTINTLFSTLKTKMDISEGIKITNSLLKLKNEFDTYTTIDLIEIDKTSLIANFYKCGAFWSIIKRKEELFIVENYALPIGIIDKVNVVPYKFKLEKDDIIFMMSDGIIDEFNQEIKNIILSNNETNVQILSCELYAKFYDLKQIKDDATFVCIKID